MRANPPEEAKPLTEPVFLILLSLADRPKHGYALMKDIESLSNGRVRLSTGTLYGALRRLLDDSWIEPFQQEDSSREKQAYRLTEIGRYSQPGVSHLNVNQLLAVRYPHRNLAPRLIVLDRVAHQVPNQHVEADRVSAHWR